MHLKYIIKVNAMTEFQIECQSKLQSKVHRSNEPKLLIFTFKKYLLQDATSC